MDPPSRVRETCAHVIACAEHVSIDDTAIQSVAERLASEKHVASVEWDAEGWHYCDDAKTGGPLTAQYVFVLDALNFCFWPEAGVEYDSLALALKDVLTADSEAFTGAALSKVTADTLKAWFAPRNFTLPLLEERASHLREMGAMLQAECDGKAANLVARAAGSAVTLVRLVASLFPGFRDQAVYKGRQIFFYKRAQILVGDLWAAYGRGGTAAAAAKAGDADTAERLAAYSFSDIHRLTMFADYRVPQLLREWGALKYSKALGAAVDAKKQIPYGSHEETEIRAATVVAVDRLAEALASLGTGSTLATTTTTTTDTTTTGAGGGAGAGADAGSSVSTSTGKGVAVKITAVELDWRLWQLGESSKDEIGPHHRTLTVFY